ncbi:hypothetical protein BDW62DRAFT_211480 [Aspergillus aurantiobrunneus]
MASSGAGNAVRCKDRRRFFSRSYVLRASDPKGNTHTQQAEDLQRYLYFQLTTPKLNRIHHFLWLAGLPRPELVKRPVILTESPDEHLVWSPGNIPVKPVPEYLLDNEFWIKDICPHHDLHVSACGLLLSYTWLFTSTIGFQMAKDERILPGDVTWEAWALLVRELLDLMEDAQNDTSPLTINRRYEYGELRLSRLNPLYRLTPSTFSLRNLVFGFMPSSTWYRAFFERNFSWMLAVLVYMSVLLSAMQVGLATDELQGNRMFQDFCFVFALVSIFFTATLIGIIAMLWTLLFCYHLGFTIMYHRKLKRER